MFKFVPTKGKKPGSRGDVAQLGNEVPHTQREGSPGGRGGGSADDDDGLYSHTSESPKDHERVRAAAQPAASQGGAAAAAAAAKTTAVTAIPARSGNGKGSDKRDAGSKNRNVSTGNPAARAMENSAGILPSIDGRVALVGFMAFSAVNCFFMILATALSQLDVLGGGCYTYWGYKENCDTVSYSNRTVLLTCKATKKRLQAGAAFSIFAILLMTTLLYLIFNAFMSYRAESRKNRYSEVHVVEGGQRNQQHGQQQQRETAVPLVSKWHIVGVAAVALLCEMICWTMSASIYASRYCEDKTLPRTTTYGVGFGLLLTGWTAEVAALVVFVLAV
ncbi:putative amastin [Trypanosoma grayi]|uniref:putative amastin n=1 Tax=Trypanosoma grayi TaxID=71804 RepID=UPI0004F4852C|nr:putative amastin [Trypanosoma grayi]KEG08521.1 putative amastin [Trypanosoma grayi]